MLHGLYENHNLNVLYINKFDNSLPKCIKEYTYKFLPETVVQENGYPLYCRRNNGRYYKIPHP